MLVRGRACQLACRPERLQTATRFCFIESKEKPVSLPSQMNVIEIREPGAPGVLQLARRPMPQPGLGEALVKVAASGVNRPDVLQRKGKYPPPAGITDVPGLEVAGEIVGGDEAALAAAGWRLGDLVCALVAGGGYAEHVVVPVPQMLPVPEGFSLVEAAALPETFFTVWSNVFMRARLQPGESLLVQGGSSGIGVTAIQLARLMGARVMATVGTPAKAQAVLGLGAERACVYREQDFEAEIASWTQGRGVDVILDMVAGDYVAREVRSLAEDGRLVLIAVQGGVSAQFDAGLVLRRRLHVMGSTLRARPVAVKGEIAASLREHVWPRLANAGIRPVIHAVYPAGEASEAHALMESSQHIGKIVLTW